MSLIAIVVVLLVVGVALYLIGMIPMGTRMHTIIRVVVILFVVIWLLQALGLLPGAGIKLK